MVNETEIRPFRVDMPDEAIANLRQRIAATRWPTKELVADRSQGVQLVTNQELARYWTTEYDWRKCEAKLNALPQFTTEIDGVDIHFIHVKSRHENALPLIMTHGWPGSVIELLETIGPLIDPTAHGGSAEDAFHLVLPSIPGYGGPLVLGGRTSPSARGRPAATAGQAPGRLHHVPRRDLPGPAQLGREGLPHPPLLPRGRRGRPLRRLGTTATVLRRDPGGLQAAALNVIIADCRVVDGHPSWGQCRRPV
jgi:hypothetical protein